MIGPGIVIPGNHIGQESHPVVVVHQGIDRIQILGRIDGLGLEAQMTADVQGRLVHFQSFLGQDEGKMPVIPEIQEPVLVRLGQQGHGLRILFTEGKKDLFFSQGQEVDFLMDHRRRIDGKVQLPLDHQELQMPGFPVHDADLVLGKAFLDVLEVGGQEPFAVELGNSDAQLPLFFLLPMAHGLFQVLHLSEDGLSFFYVVGAGRGEFHLVPVAVEQGHPQIFFQPPDVLAQGRLADEQHLGSLGKAAGPGNGHYIFQVAGIHRHPLLIT